MRLLESSPRIPFRTALGQYRVSASAAAPVLCTPPTPVLYRLPWDMHAPVAASLPHRCAAPPSFRLPEPWTLDPGQCSSPGTYPVSPPYRRREVVRLHRGNIFTRLCFRPCAHAPWRVAGQHSFPPRYIRSSYDRRKVIPLPRRSRARELAGLSCNYRAVPGHGSRDPFGAFRTDVLGLDGSCDGYRMMTAAPTAPLDHTLFFTMGGKRITLAVAWGLAVADDSFPHCG